MKYVVDTSLINKLIDGAVRADELPKDGSFVASHIQIDELKQTKNPERRSKLLEMFAETVNEVLPTESFIMDVSRLDGGKLGDGVSYHSIRRELDSLNGGKSNNSQDALIAEIAMKNEYVLLTANFHLYQAAYSLGIGVMYWTTT